jgi:hypothetical protein
MVELAEYMSTNYISWFQEPNSRWRFTVANKMESRHQFGVSVHEHRFYTQNRSFSWIEEENGILGQSWSTNIDKKKSSLDVEHEFSWGAWSIHNRLSCLFRNHPRVAAPIVSSYVLYPFAPALFEIISSFCSLSYVIIICPAFVSFLLDVYTSSI